MKRIILAAFAAIVLGFGAMPASSHDADEIKQDCVVCCMASNVRLGFTKGALDDLRQTCDSVCNDIVARATP